MRGDCAIRCVGSYNKTNEVKQRGDGHIVSQGGKKHRKDKDGCRAEFTRHSGCLVGEGGGAKGNSDESWLTTYRVLIDLIYYL